MGAGGNLLRNIFSLSPKYEMLSEDKAPMEQHLKEQFMLGYYSQSINSDTWLKREWSIRQGLYTKYYEAGLPTYWNPESLIAYDNHGAILIKDIGNHLSHWDRYKINEGTITEQISPWALQDCSHVFITTDNLNLLAEIYNSKNPTIDQFVKLTDFNQRYQEFLLVNGTLHNNLLKLSDWLIQNNKQIYNISVQDLFTDSGHIAIRTLAASLNLTINQSVIQQIHHLWLQSTREVYYNYFNRDLTI